MCLPYKIEFIKCLDYLLKENIFRNLITSGSVENNKGRKKVNCNHQNVLKTSKNN